MFTRFTRINNYDWFKCFANFTWSFSFTKFTNSLTANVRNALGSPPGLVSVGISKKVVKWTSSDGTIAHTLTNFPPIHNILWSLSFLSVSTFFIVFSCRLYHPSSFLSFAFLCKVVPDTCTGDALFRRAPLVLLAVSRAVLSKLSTTTKKSPILL